MNKNLLTVSILIALTFVLGCDSPPNDRATSQGVVNVEDDDPEMIAAIETAKKTFEFFEKNWKNMKNDGYSLKFALPTTDGELEHIWFSPVEIQGDKITGRCANDPVKIPGLKMDDTRTVARDDVSDWMIVVGNTCYGGYTIRVLASRDPDAAPPLKFMDPPAD